MAKEGERLEERMRGLAALSAIAEAISGSLDLDEILDKALERVMEFLGVEVGAIYLFAEGKGQGKLAAHRGLSDEFVRWANTTQLDQRTIKRLTKAAKNRRPLLIIEEVFKQRELLKDIKAAIAREKAHSYLPILLRFKEDLLGVMVVASRQPREFTPEEIDFSVAIGLQIGVAIENARLYQEQRRRLGERMRAEEALRESHESYKELADSITDVFFAMDKDLRYTYWNKASEDLTGISARDAIGKSLYDLFLDTPQTRRAEKVYLDVLRTQQPQTFVNEYELVGQNFVFEISAYPSVDGLSVFVKDITERKRAEEALWESEERFQRIARATNDAIWDLDLVTKTVWWNEGVKTLFGYGADEAGSDPTWWREHIHPEDRERVISGIYAVVNGGKKFWSDEYRYQRADGSYAHVFDRGYVLHDDSGKPLRMVGGMVDITERKRAEEEIRTLGQFLDSVIDNANVWLDVLDEKANVVIWNRAAEEISGYSREEVVGHDKIWEWLYPDEEYRNEITARAAAIIERGEVVEDFETTIRRKDGQTRIISWNSRNLADEKGNPIGSIALGRDITERKRAEEVLRESEERYHAIFEQAADSIVLIDGETGVLVGFNERAHQNLGYTREEFQKLKIPDFEVIESAEEVAKHIEKIIKDGADTFETKHRTKDGEIRDIQVSSRAISIGGRDFVQSIWRDITERKRAEEEIRQRSEELAALNAIAETISRSLDLDGVLNSALDKVLEITDFEAGGIALMDETAEKIVPVVHRHVPQDFLATFAEPRAGGGFRWQTVESGESIFFEDIPHDPRLRSHAGVKEGFYAAAYIPLRTRDRVVGFMGLGTRQEHHFTPKEKALLTTISNQIGVAIENARLYEERKRKAEELAVLNEIGRAVSSVMQLDDLLELISQETSRVIDTSNLFIALYDGKKNEVSFPLYFEEGQRRKPEKRPARRGITEYVINTAKPLIINRNLPSQLKELDVDLIGRPSKSWLGVPMLSESQVIGVLAIQDYQNENAYDESHLRLLSTVASQAVIAIENARLFEGERRKATQLAVINEVSRKAISILDLHEMLKEVAHAICSGFNYYNVSLFLVDKERHEAVMEAVAGGFEHIASGEYRQSLDQGIIGWVIRTGESWLANDVSQDPYYIKGFLEEVVTESEMCVPIKLGEEVIGVLDIQSILLNAFDETDVTAMETLSRQIAIAIQNARLYEQTDEKLQHRVAELTALNTITQSLTRSLELDEILESIVSRVAQVMRTRICTIRLVEGNELTTGAAVGYGDESSRQHTIKIDERLARIIRDQQPLLVEDLWETEDIPLSRRERAKHEEVHAFLGVPMISGEKTIGILSVYRGEPHRFREEEVRLLSTVANQTAVAIERARLHEKVREHAVELEQLVQERTKELQAMYAELLQSAKLAALGQLVAGVAHELNNPLGAISGYLELLQEEIELGPRDMEYVERIEKRIQQATRIVGELRSLGMPSEPAWQIVDVNDILEETLTLIERRLSLHQIRVQKDMTLDLPPMYGDPDRLEQVFINLITNARQAMEEGGTLRIASRESRNGEWVEIIFADTGVGIAKEHLNKIFDPFFTTRSPGKGMGLGLSLSHRHIKDHGGTIDVWSEKGRGTVFRIALPPSRAKRCWEIIDCDKKELCKAVRENADYRCWSVMEDVSLCKRCEVYRRKALPPLDGNLLPQ